MSDEQWRRGVERDSERMRRAARGSRSLLDGLGEDYTVRWTLNCILLGLVLGATNVYVFIRKYW